MDMEEFFADLDTEEIKGYDWYYLGRYGFIRASVELESGQTDRICPIEAIEYSKTGVFISASALMNKYRISKENGMRITRAADNRKCYLLSSNRNFRKRMIKILQPRAS